MINKNKIKAIIDNSLLETYNKILDEKSTEEEFIDIFWELINSIYSYILGYIRKKIPEAKTIHLNLKELLYDDLDEDRIKKYYQEFKSVEDLENILKARINFLNKLQKIYVTETGLIRDKTFFEIAKKILEKYPDDKVYHYYISITYGQSQCGEIGGTESEEIISKIKLTQKNIEGYYESELDCTGHPDCPGHCLDIDFDKEEIIENREELSEILEKGVDIYDV